MRLVERHYGKITRRELVARYLPQRTIKGVERIADLLGVSKRRGSVAGWSARELALLRRHCGTLTVREIRERYLPHRTAKAIGHRARRLGLHTKEPDWSASEKRILRRYHGRISNAELARRHLKGRSAGAIQIRARLLGLAPITAPVRKRRRRLQAAGRAGRRWTPEEMAILREHPASSARDLQALLPGRSRRAILGARSVHGVRRPSATGAGSHWSAREMAVLRRHPNARASALVALLPGRSWRAVYERLRLLRSRQPTSPAVRRRGGGAGRS
jgi:hypothetical protein